VHVAHHAENLERPRAAGRRDLDDHFFRDLGPILRQQQRSTFGNLGDGRGLEVALASPSPANLDEDWQPDVATSGGQLDLADGDATQELDLAPLRPGAHDGATSSDP